MTAESFSFSASVDAVSCARSLSIFVTCSPGDEDSSEIMVLANWLTSRSAVATARCCALAMMLSSSASFTKNTRCNFSTANCAEDISALWCGPSLAGTSTVEHSSYDPKLVLRLAASTKRRSRAAEPGGTAKSRSCCSCRL